MKKIRLGIIGSGMIAGVIVDACKSAPEIVITAVASRNPLSATKFAASHQINQVFNNWQEMLNSEEIDAIYIATPTSVREEIAIAATESNKHILVEKPFASAESVQKIGTSAMNHQVVFLDATHFVHNPRTIALQNTLESSGNEIGAINTLRSSFFMPLADPSNIRFDQNKEPTGALGDLAWYCMRAVVEFLKPSMEATDVHCHLTRDKNSNTVIRCTGFIAFQDGKTTSFDAGFDSDSCLMDLDLIGKAGSICIDDFVLDWKHGFPIKQPQHQVGYSIRKNLQALHQFDYVISESNLPQASLMLKEFAKQIISRDIDQSAMNIQKTQHTQKLLDMLWQSAKHE